METSQSKNIYSTELKTQHLFYKKNSKLISHADFYSFNFFFFFFFLDLPFIFPEKSDS